MSMDWFRWWHGTANDPKFRLVARDSNIPVASVIGVWAVILESASLNNPRGTIEIDFEVLEYQIGIDDAKKIIDSMCKRAMLLDVTPCNANVTPSNNDVTLQNVTRLYSVKNWDKRQPKREREDDSAERVRKHREAAKALKESNNKEGKDNVTPCNAMKRLDTDEIREDEKDLNICKNEKPVFTDDEDHSFAKAIPCPRKKIYSEYRKILPELTDHRDSGIYEQGLTARWKWVMNRLKETGRPQTEAEGISYFTDFFLLVKQCPFLMGQVPATAGRLNPFVVDLKWLVGRDNFAKVIDGKFLPKEKQ